MPGHDYAAAEVLTAANMDAFSNNSYYAQMRQTSGQSITNNTFTALTFTTEDFDTDSGHDTGSNTSRYTAQTAGRYEFSGGHSWAADAAGVRESRWAKNGSAVNGSGIRIQAVAANIVAHPARTIIIDMAVSDYVELQVLQSSGASLSTDASGTYMSTMTVKRVSS